MDDDDEIPPLEDMSDSFQMANSAMPLKMNTYLEVEGDEEKQKSKIVNDMLKEENSTTNVNEASSSVNRRSAVKKTDTFCGFQKGFLLKNKNRQKEVEKNEEEIVEVTKQSKQENLFPEVQEAMKTQVPLLNSNAWVTEDLISKIMANPKLRSKLMHPQFSDVLGLLHSDPRKAIEVYRSNPEMTEFIQEFCSLMGDHFTNLAEIKEKIPEVGSFQQASNATIKTHEEPAIARETGASGKDTDSRFVQRGSQTDNSDKQVQDILSNPHLVEILQDEEIKNLFAMLRNDPHMGFKYLQSSSPEIKEKVQILVNAGLLQVKF